MKGQLTLLLSIVLGFMSFGQNSAQLGQQIGTASSVNQNTTENPQDLHTPTPISSNYATVQEIGNQPPLTSTSAPGTHTCKTHELNQEHYHQRGILDEFNQDAFSGAQSASNFTPKTSGTNEISVIFHVVHNPNNPAENVSNALIMQVYNDLVEDFLLQNANAAGARTAAPFNFVPANANINYCLATQDPNGTPLTEVGVVRVATTEDFYDSDNGEENKMKAAATGGSEIWDRNDYLNIYICDISNGANSGTAGYAYRPTATFLPSAAIDAIVLDYNLGVNNENVLTHEVGHYLGLDHPWGGSGGCGNDDGFADTPVTTGPSFDYPGSCSGSQQTCGAVEVQYENYMDYANCTVMFTTEQANYMLSILQGVRGSLLLSPGCDPVDAPPVVDFTADIPSQIIIPVGGSVNFFSQATNNPNAWTWDFGGGSPNSTVENPSATFNTIGVYTVTHTATNGFGTGSETKVGFVEVVAAATGIACDTLRNYIPSDPFFTITTGGGYAPGNATVSGQNALQWAEPYSAPLSTEVRRLRFIPTVVNDNGGNAIFKVYGPGITPGAVLATETVPLADLNALQYNIVDFTTPATVTGNFWVGFELSYNGTDTLALLTTYDNVAPSTNYSYAELATNGWTDISTLFGGAPGFASIMDVLTSNGPAPVADFTFSGTEVCIGGSTTVNGSSSTNTSDYQWYLTDNPITTIFEIQDGAGQTFVHPVAGDEIIFLFADGSCLTDVASLDITVHPAITASATVTNTSCGNNNGIITITTPAGGSGTTYSYSMDGVNYQASNVFDNLAAGTYDIYISTPGDNCISTATITINASTPFAATVGPNSSFCLGGTATLTASGGVNYEWFDGSTSIATVATTTVTPNTPTQYSCLVTDAAGCQSTVYTTVTVYDNPTAPTITASGPTTFCDGGSVDLTSSETTGNVWSTTETTQTITVNASGSYSIVYTDANGCTATSAATAVTVNPLPAAPTVTPAGPITACSGGTANLSSSYATGNTWSTTETTQAIVASTSGTYSVTHTDANGCTSAQTDVLVTVDPAVTISAANTNPSACGSSDGQIVVSGTGTGTLSWVGTASGNSGGSITLPFTITGLPAGSYTIDFSTDAGCSSNTLNETLTDPLAPAVPTVTASGPTTFCTGGSVDLTSSYATGNTWSTTETTQTITVTTAGSYTVTYDNGSGCTSTSLPIVVTVNTNPAAPTVTPAGPVTACAGGTVNLSSSYATGNTWSTTETTQAIVASTTGTYSVTHTDANGCSSAQTDVLVTIDPAVTISATNSDPTTCSGTDGQIIINGTGTGTVIWTGSASGNSGGSVTLPFTITGLAAGSYTVDFTTDAGCASNTLNETLTDPTAPAIPTVTNSGPLTFCSGGSVDLTSSYTTGNTWSTTETTQTITVTTSGTYTVDHDNGTGCIVTSAPITVTVNPTSVITSGTVTNPTTCATTTGSIEITGTGTGTVTWTGTATGNSGGSVTLPYTITGLAAGAYTIDFTSDAGCAANTLNETLTDPTPPAAPTVNASGPISFCGGSVDLTSSELTGNVWSTTETTQSITVSTSGTYSVTYTDANGCSATSVPTTITVFPVPVITAGTVTATTTCGTPTATLEITGTGTGDLVVNGPTASTPTAVTLPYTITGLLAGSYNVTFTSTDGCTSNTITQAIVDGAAPPAPTISASGATTFCDGGSVDLTSSEATGNDWSTTETTQTITVTTSGTYTVTFTDGAGCTSVSAPTTVTVNALPAAPTVSASGPLTFCDGGSVDLSSSELTGNVWSTTETTQTITATTNGTYSVDYTDGNGCSSSSAPVTVVVNALPTTPTITSSGGLSFCTGGSVDLTSSEVTGNDWSTTETTQTITVTTAGPYSVSVTDVNGCTATSAVSTITVNATPAAPTIAASGSTVLCVGETVDLTSSEPAGNTWSTTETTQTITVTNTGAYSVTYTDANGCSATSATLSVSGNNQPTVTAGTSQTICEGETVTLNGAGAQTYTWDNGVTDNVPFTPTPGTITYTVTGTDASGCSGTATVDVIVNPTPSVSLSTDATTCVDYGTSTLVGDPVGGIFLGAHVSGDQFNPSSAGIGTHTIYYEFTSTEGCVGTAMTTIIVNGCAFVGQLDQQEVLVYPNPMENVLHIQLSGEFSIVMFDASGRVVFNGNGIDEVEVNTFDFDAGVYLLQVNNGTSNETIRVVKN